MMLLASDYDKSKYLKATDLEREKKFRIKKVLAKRYSRTTTRRKRNSSFGSPTMSGAWCLNKINNRTIRGAYGDPTRRLGRQDHRDISDDG